MSSDLQQLLHGLIEADLTLRLGCLRSGVADIKQHAWFKDTDWLAVYYQQVSVDTWRMSLKFFYLLLADRTTTRKAICGRI